ncbi:NAD(P)/FAD-dependent oxidoreductase [Rhodococcus sp. NPDC059968]|uniref:NAD(P)/FAD-dependent oxidoreductase n=1 Tax=Rhodococcus sp. NPDC059968 TaxID=3347017 RepID=UPI00366C5A55
MNAGTLIVGACQAGVQIAVSLRELGYTEPITLVGAEPYHPYQRPPLSKAYLAGDATPSSLSLRNPEFYTDNKIDLVLGERVTSVDLDAGSAQTGAGRQLPFGSLALATGARVRRLSIPGSNLNGVFYLRDIDDADLLARALPDVSDVVVIGGGFIGLEAAAVARVRGKKVTVIEATPRLVARAVAPVVSDFLAQAHRRRGSRVLLGRSVAGLESVDGAVSGVRLDDGELVRAQLVVVGVGVIPRTELAEQIGLGVESGILVDKYARTSDHRVVAAGDCTTMPHPMSASGHVRLESVQNAQDQSRVAAASVMGQPTPYTAVPWFWSDQAELKLQITGLSLGFDDVVVRGNLDEEKFTALYYKNGRLIAADCVNRAPEYMAVRRALAVGATIPAQRGADISTPLKELVVPASARV